MKRKASVDRLCGQIGRGAQDTTGAAAVEFALVLPIILLLLFGIIEFGRAWNVRQTLTDAAREGARLAAVGNGVIPQGTLEDSVRKIVRAAAERAALDLSKLDITTQGVSGGGGTPTTVNLRYGYTPLFGTWVLPGDDIPMRTSSVMRNE
jgi:Flp pilus assembly protein TadG